LETPSTKDIFSSRIARIKVKKKQSIYVKKSTILLQSHFCSFSGFKMASKKLEGVIFKFSKIINFYFVQHLYMSFLGLKRPDFDRFKCLSKGSEEQSSLADM